ncbi:hypothetical protein PpBr36_00084 [Pyricularia pennisetigena]|uniref:hypothetical protein n=1 Tax=Pyricularia pennisetigena TaxID=1578925 RepID=UPI00114F6185|nr:hypothetical protein PpBr36_00084 [Pyricularia pennisetigena]TLS29231.1 hypothetical protein PpBr36_00084 [Pyricularia pennisetigena]
MHSAQALSFFALLIGSGLANPVPPPAASSSSRLVVLAAAAPAAAAAAPAVAAAAAATPAAASPAAATPAVAAPAVAAPAAATAAAATPAAATPAAAAPAAEVAAGATNGTIAIPQGFSKIVFEDNFAKSTAATVDQAKWLVDLGTQYPGGAANWGTQEIQTYTNDPANLAVKNGVLKITPIRKGDAWTSARIETKAGSDVQCPVGGKLRIEASLKIPATDAATQLGIWPAFWMLGQGFRTDRNSWPKVGEIDILEVSNGVGTVFHTAHCGIINGGPCNEKTGLGGSGQFPRGKFVKVAVTIDRSNKGDFKQEKLEWSVDGKVTHTLTGAEVKDADAWENLARTPKMILLNIAIGGEFPDAKAKIKTPTAQTVGGDPSSMEVQYVAAFST